MTSQLALYGSITFLVIHLAAYLALNPPKGF